MGNNLSRDELLPGPWDSDLDAYPGPNFRHEFIHQPSGYRCLVERKPFNWTYCGFVTLPRDHPDWPEVYEILNDDLLVHGGLTYGEDGRFGFDCYHTLAGDLSPADETEMAQEPTHQPQRLSPPHYWTFEEVKKETESLAEQFYAREK